MRALSFCLLLTGLTFGCQRGQSQIGSAELPAIPIARPVEREVTVYVEFTGRTDAVESVNIVPRVTGYLTRMAFREGSEVGKGDILFEIDPRPYEAQFDQAESQVQLAKTQLDLTEKTLTRYMALKGETPGAVSDQAIDQYKAAVEEAKARVNANQKSLEVYRLNKDFTTVRSPINGQVSRYYLTLGNLVNQDQTLLTTVVSLDPIYAYFDIDERTLLQIRRAINEGRIQGRRQRQGLAREDITNALVAGQGLIAPRLPAALTGLGVSILSPAVMEPDIPVFMEVQGEEGYPHRGVINFSNNIVNSSTGSISVRGRFANPRPRIGVRLLSPGMFVRIRLPLGEPRPSLLVIDRAVQSDQGLKYVYVIDADNKAQSRRITTGALQEDGLRVVTEGLKKEDWVVVGAMQQVRPGMEMKPDRRDKMPSFQP